MEIRFNHNFYVMNMDDNFDYDSFENKINEKLYKDYDTKRLEAIFRTNNENLWDIEFDLIYNDVEEILVYKKRQIIKEEKCLLYKIHVPVPKKKEIYWGIEEVNFLSNKGKLNLDNFSVVKKSDLNHFSDINAYLIDCVLLAIKNIISSILNNSIE